MIDELVREASDRCGLAEGQTRIALSGALALIEKHGDPEKVTELFAEIEGAGTLAEEGRALMQTKSGLMAGLIRGAGGDAGAAMSDAMAMGPRLAREGVTTSDMQAILPVAMEFVRAKSGRDLLREVLLTVPGLGKLLT